MINFDQTKIQKRIERVVTKGLGFNSSTSYDDYGVAEYRVLIPEDIIKNTYYGLQAHLAEMNMDQYLRQSYFKYRGKSKKIKPLGKMLLTLGAVYNTLRNERLKMKAAKSALTPEEKKYIRTNNLMRVVGIKNPDEILYFITKENS